MSYSVKLVSQAKEPPGQQVFTNSGTFTVPKGIKQIGIFCVGGGAGTGNINDVKNTHVSNIQGGGGGGYTATGYVNVYPGQQIGVTVGSGGVYDIRAVAGGESNAGGVVANGAVSYGAGGSGGAIGSSNPYPGGSDGSKGGWNGHSYNGWDGQGTTTRAFGESWGTLYAGGGGGWRCTNSYEIAGGAGGAGGGGNGAAVFSNGSNIVDWGTWGAAGTGGGSGGGTHGGGSGAVLIRWS